MLFYFGLEKSNYQPSRIIVTLCVREIIGLTFTDREQILEIKHTTITNGLLLLELSLTVRTPHDSLILWAFL